MAKDLNTGTIQKKLPHINTSGVYDSRNLEPKKSFRKKLIVNFQKLRSLKFLKTVSSK